MKIKKLKGFTLVELLVVVVIIGILAAIALPNFIGAQQKAKTAAVRGNMRTSQIASESYATDSGGVYSPDAATMKSYYPGGQNTLGGSAGTFPTNPITGVANESPQTGGPTTSTALQNERTNPPGTFLTKGQHSYDAVDTGNSYAVMGSDATGVHVAGTNGKRLVLSNQ